MSEDAPESAQLSHPEVPQLRERASGALLCFRRKNSKCEDQYRARSMGENDGPKEFRSLIGSEEGGLVTRQERTEAANGNVAIGGHEGVEVRLIAQLGEAAGSLCAATFRH